MQPIQVTVTALEGESVHVQLPDGKALTLPMSAFPPNIKTGEVLSFMAFRGHDLLNEILRDEGKT